MTNPKEQRPRELSEEFFLKVVRDWKHFWMNQRQNSKEDHENYCVRALGVDANMTHHLAKMLNESIVKIPGAILLTREQLRAAWEKHDIPWEGPWLPDIEDELFGAEGE